MDNKIIKQLIDEAAACGQPNARIRDVGFAILNHVIKAPKMAYAMMFPTENENNYEDYAKSELQKTLAKRVKVLLTPPKQATEQNVVKQRNEDEITADENRIAMMKMLKEIEDEKAKPDADISKLLKIEADIRTKLKDKFEVSQSAEQQLILVQPKFNHICEKTGKECWLQTKEFAMKQWGLIDPDEQP